MTKAELAKQEKKESTGRIRRENQKLILTAAEKEFVNYGFKGASMQRIAELAGIPRANLHYYYKNKVVLYDAILGNIIETWNRKIDTIKAEDDPRQALTAYIHAKIMYSKTNPEASRIFSSEIIHGAPHLTEYLQVDFRRWIKEKSDAIQSWIDSGKMDPIDPMQLLFFIWGSTQHYADFGVQVLAAMEQDKLSDEDYEHIAESLTQLVIKGCGIR